MIGSLILKNLYVIHELFLNFLTQNLHIKTSMFQSANQEIFEQSLISYPNECVVNFKTLCSGKMKLNQYELNDSIIKLHFIIVYD